MALTKPNYWLKLYYKMLRDPDIAALPAGG